MRFYELVKKAFSELATNPLSIASNVFFAVFGFRGARCEARGRWIVCAKRITSFDDMKGELREVVRVARRLLGAQRIRDVVLVAVLDYNAVVELVEDGKVEFEEPHAVVSGAAGVAAAVARVKVDGRFVGYAWLLMRTIP